MNSIFSSLPDEILHSWLYRGAYQQHPAESHRDFADRSLRFKEAIHYCALIDDPDFKLVKLQIEELATILAFEFSEIDRVCTPLSRWLLPVKLRNFYCPYCIDEDIAGYHMPTWHKSWCHALSTHCHKHKCLLKQLGKQTCAHKSWSAFSIHHLDTSLELSHENSKSVSSCFETECFEIANQVVQTIDSHLEHSLPHTAASDSRLDLGSCSIALIKLFLIPQTPRTPPGIARLLCSGPPYRKHHNLKHYREIYDEGIYSATKKELCVAILLMAWVMGNHAGYDGLFNLITGLPFGNGVPSSVYRLGTYALTTASPYAFREFTKPLREFSREAYVSELLAGLESVKLSQGLKRRQ